MLVASGTYRNGVLLAPLIAQLIDEEIAQAAKAYRVVYQAHIDGLHAVNGADYVVDHSSDIYLMSPEGKFVAYYSAGILPDEMAADLMVKTRSSG